MDELWTWPDLSITPGFDGQFFLLSFMAFIVFVGVGLPLVNVGRLALRINFQQFLVLVQDAGRVNFHMGKGVDGID